jgi:HlyD family secretion protein
VSQVVGLQAEQARLQAEQASAASIAWPETLTSLSGDDRLQAQKAMLLQETEFRDRARDLASHKAVLRQRMSELSEQIGGYQRQIDAAVEQKRLVADQLSDVKSLADQGYAPMSQVRSLQRDNADLDGRSGEYAAQIAQARQQIGELQLQILQLDADQRDEVAKDLRDLQFQLNELLPKLTEAADQLAHTEVRAPMSGTVVGLNVFTVGGVIGPGQKLLDVVPDKSELVIEAQIAPADIDGLHVGQVTEVRLGAERDRTLPILKGALTQLSADSLVNSRTGSRYFAAQVTIPPDQLALLKTSSVKDFEVRPGLPAQVVIPVAQRTALQFLMEPLTKTLWRFGRER